MNVFRVLGDGINAGWELYDAIRDPHNTLRDRVEREGVERTAEMWAGFTEAEEQQEVWGPDELWRPMRPMDGGPGRRTGEATARPVQSGKPAGYAPTYCGSVCHAVGTTYICGLPNGHEGQHSSHGSINQAGAVTWFEVCTWCRKARSECKGVHDLSPLLDVVAPQSSPAASQRGESGPAGSVPPDPAGATPTVPFNHEWSPKSLKEKLCIQQTWIPPDDLERLTRSAFSQLMCILDMHRPLASNGKHGNLHTDTCGCEDK